MHYSRKQSHIKNLKNKITDKSKRKSSYTSAGIRTRVRALATPGDNHYTTDVHTELVPRPGLEPGTTASSGQRSPKLSYLGIGSTT